MGPRGGGAGGPGWRCGHGRCGAGGASRAARRRWGTPWRGSPLTGPARRWRHPPAPPRRPAALPGRCPSCTGAGRRQGPGGGAGGGGAGAATEQGGRLRGKGGGHRDRRWILLSPVVIHYLKPPESALGLDRCTTSLSLSLSLLLCLLLFSL